MVASFCRNPTFFFSPDNSAGKLSYPIHLFLVMYIHRRHQSRDNMDGPSRYHERLPGKKKSRNSLFNEDYVLFVPLRDKMFVTLT